MTMHASTEDATEVKLEDIIDVDRLCDTRYYLPANPKRSLISEATLFLGRSFLQKQT